MCLVANIIRMNLSGMKDLGLKVINEGIIPIQKRQQIETKRLTNLMYSDQVNQRHLHRVTHKVIILQLGLNGVERTLFKPIQPPILGGNSNINVLSDSTNQGMTKNYGEFVEDSQIFLESVQFGYVPYSLWPFLWVGVLVC